MHRLGDAIGRCNDVRDIRIAGLAQRRGHADVDAVSGADDGRVGGCQDPSSFHLGAEARGGDVGHVRFAAADHLDLGGVDLQAGYLEAGLGKAHRQWQADVAEPDDANVGAAIFDTCEELRHRQAGSHESAQIRGIRLAV